MNVADVLAVLDLERLPLALTSRQVAALWGVSEDLVHKLARNGTAPVEPLHLGRCWRFPTALVIADLGIQREDGGPDEPTVDVLNPLRHTGDFDDGTPRPGA